MSRPRGFGATLYLAVGATFVATACSKPDNAGSDTGAVASQSSPALASVSISTSTSTSASIFVSPAGLKQAPVILPTDYHRADPTTCAVVETVPRKGLSTKQTCLADGDCSKLGPTGRCVLGTCRSECSTDADCSGRVCRCDPVLKGVCLEFGTCRFDGDCKSAFCAPSRVSVCPDQSATIGFFCRTEADTCHRDADCVSEPGDSGPNPSACVFDRSRGHWACSVCPAT